MSDLFVPLSVQPYSFRNAFQDMADTGRRFLNRDILLRLALGAKADTAKPSPGFFISGTT